MTDTLFPAAPRLEPLRPGRRPRSPHAVAILPVGVGWTLTDHVCAVCLGRVLARATPMAIEFRCADCAASGFAVGTATGSICSCRARVAKRDAGVRCVRNPKVTPEAPTEFIAKG